MYRIALFILTLGLTVHAQDLRLPKVFGSNMVLQRDLALPVWGWAAPGADVSVSFAGKTVSTKASASGKWKLKLAALTLSSEPQALEVKAGDKQIKLTNILVGDVWLCSGQSNMEWRVTQSLNPKEEVAAADWPLIRIMDVNAHNAKLSPIDDVPSTGWHAVSPKTISNFSAVGYYFGRKLHQDLKIPIGLIGSNWGGTRSEPWTPPEGFARVPELKNISDRLAGETEARKKARYADIQRVEAWLVEARAAQAANELPPPLSVAPERVGHQDPTRIYNGMIHGLVPFGIKGAIWYQGESNAGDGQGYFLKKKALIEGWREIWDQGEFPFYFVQLAPFRGFSHWAPVWGGQIATLQLPNTGMAVTTDIGNLRDIHPKDKQNVGLRLALQALHGTYGQDDLVYQGPLFKSAEFADGKAICSFDSVGGGLAANDGEALRSFQVAGSDKRFMAASAEIVGNTIVVSSGAVPVPVAVRMCWSGTKEQPNLANQEGLPASPFRSDSW